MKYKLRHILAISVLIAAAGWSPGRAQDTKYGGAFLELGLGPRALGMGSAYVALADDGSGFYWNPAGVASIPRLHLSLMYANLFNSLENHGYAGVMMPVFGNAVVGASWIRLAVEDIPQYWDPDLERSRDERYGDPIGSGLNDPASGYFNFVNNAYFFTFSRLSRIKADFGWQYFELPVDISYGVNFKVIDIGLAGRSGTGVGVDAGFKVLTGLDDLFADENYGKLSIGISSFDLFGTSISWDTNSKQKDEIENFWRFGFAYTQPMRFMNSEFVMTYDVLTRYEGSWHLGFELIYHELLALRSGFNDGEFTAGAGLTYWLLTVDYAYQGHDLGNSHRVGLSIQF